jgi:hypothetical protein
VCRMAGARRNWAMHRREGVYSERRLATGGQIHSSVRGAAASDRAVAVDGDQEVTCRSSAETWSSEAPIEMPTTQSG